MTKGKKQRQNEKHICEWREKTEMKSTELENSQNELIKKSCEIHKLKNEIEDIQSLTEIFCKEKGLWFRFFYCYKVFNLEEGHGAIGP